MAKDSTTELVCVLIVVFLAIGATATLQDDEAECAQHLADLAACIPFVSGTAKKPTTECCQDAKKLKATEPKCLCVLIIASTDPSMGLPVNTTLALQMPSACNIDDAKASNCPSLLNISPDSPDAKVFKEAGISDSSSSTTGSATAAGSPPNSASTSSGSSSSSSPASASSTPTDSSSQTDSKASPSSSNSQNMKAFGAWLLMAIAAGIVLLN
ncbi:Non-specific lipid transfer protein GPI-anchored 13 [Linum grandiflorum]